VASSSASQRSARSVLSSRIGASGQVVDQVLDDRQRLRVRGLQVLQHHQAAAVPPDHRQQPQQRLGQYDDRRRLGLRLPGRPLGDEPAQHPAVRPEVADPVQLATSLQGQQGLGDRPERHHRPQRPDPSPQGDQAGLQPEARGGLGQARLADTGLADQEHRPAVPLRGLIEAVPEYFELCVPPDNRRSSCPHGVVL